MLLPGWNITDGDVTRLVTLVQVGKPELYNRQRFVATMHTDRAKLLATYFFDTLSRIEPEKLEGADAKVAEQVRAYAGR